MKREFLLTFALTLSFVLFYNCSDDSAVFEQERTLKIEERINLDRLINYMNSQKPSEEETSILQVPQEIINNNIQNNSIRKEKTTTFNKTYMHIISDVGRNLNSFFVEGSENTMEVISVISFLDTENNFTGFILHIYSVLEKNLYLYPFYLTDGNDLLLIEKFPKIVNDLYFEDLYYISNTFFGQDDIKAISVRNYERPLSSDYNDLRISYIYKRYAETKNNHNSQNTVHKTSGCAVAVHFCRFGEGSCTTAGCRNVNCSAEEIPSHYISEYGMETEYSIYESFLPLSVLRDFRDEIILTSTGGELVDLYYELTNHFLNSLNIEMLIMITEISSDVRNAIDKFLDKDNNGVIIDNDLKEMITNILNKSAGNSDSNDYKEVINSLILDLNDYSGLTYDQLISKLQ